ncbi:MAG: hypothetical protein II367_05130 [Treponema sp.]|nr:hypothetical protein [Treponema sp.]
MFEVIMLLTFIMWCVFGFLLVNCKRREWSRPVIRRIVLVKVVYLAAKPNVQI